MPKSLTRSAIYSLLCCVLLFLTGCERKGSRLKKQEKPNPLVAKKVKSVSGASLASKHKALYRSARITLAEANKILGGFQYQADISYRTKRKEQRIQFSEKYSIKQQAAGPFHVHIKNNKDKGLDVIWSGSALYYRARHRDYRITSKEVYDAHRWQKRGFGRWRALVGIFGPYIQLSENGSTSHLGRSCVRYRLNFRDTPLKKVKAKEGTAWSGKVPNHTRGNARNLPRRPTSLKGEIWVDDSSGLVLKVRFEGRYSVGDKSKEGASIYTKLKAGFVSKGDPTFALPKKVLTVAMGKAPLDPFAHKKPAYLLPPPDNKKKKRRRRRKKRKRKKR